MIRKDGSIIGPCTMLDVSAGGAQLKLDAALKGGLAEFILVLSRIDPRTASAMFGRVAEDPKIFGVRFLP